MRANAIGDSSSCGLRAAGSYVFRSSATGLNSAAAARVEAATLTRLNVGTWATAANGEWLLLKTTEVTRPMTQTAHAAHQPLLLLTTFTRRAAVSDYYYY